jgi:hypothetical protein
MPTHRKSALSYLGMTVFRDSAYRCLGTARDGTRLFYERGPLSTPYVIPDSVIEKDLIRIRKRANLLISVPLVGVLILLELIEPYRQGLLSFLPILLVGAILFAEIIHRIVMVPSLRRLQRYVRRTSLRDYYCVMGRESMPSELIIGLMGSILFVAAGIGISSSGLQGVYRWFIIVFFSASTLAWGYALICNLKVHDKNGTVR